MSLRPILCVVGASGSGKTTLLERLIPELTAGGLKVAVVKHAAGGLDPGPKNGSPEKDSSRLAASGGRPAIVVGPAAGPAKSGHNLIVQHAEAETPLLDLVDQFCADCDMVLAEGYKRSPHDKILISPARQNPRGPEWQLSSVALRVCAAAHPPPGTLHRDDIAGIAEWVKRWLGRRLRIGEGVVGAVLVGGESRRMGMDKARLKFRGRSVVVNLAELLGGRLSEVWTIGRRVVGVGLPRCVGWHVDLRPGRGPLGGIATALCVAATKGPRPVLVVACDMAALAGEAVDLLLEKRKPAQGATALRDPDSGRVQPLAAVYEPAALPEIQKALAAGRLSATEILTALRAHLVEVPAEIAEQLANVNTPEDMDAMGRNH